VASACEPWPGAPPLNTIAAEASLRDALARMLEADVDRLAVVDADERFVGGLTLQGIRAHSADAAPAVRIQR
jgi:CBS domain-containing protein